MFGQYFTNLSYNLANPKPYNLTGNTWSDVVSVLTDNPIVDAGAAPSRSEMDEIITKKKFNVFPSEQTSARQKAENIIRSQYGDGVEIDPSSVDALMQFVNREGVVGTEKNPTASCEWQTLLWMRLCAFKSWSDDSQSRRLLLKNMIKMSRNNPEYARHFSSSQINWSNFGHKKICFLKALQLKEETAINNGEQHRRSRWSPETVTEEDALLFARENITEDPKHPAPFVDILHSPDINSSIKSGSSSSIWNDILSRISSTRKLEEKASVFVKNLVVKVVRQFLDILEGKLFSDGYEWDDNIPLMIGVDQILREVIKAASNMC
ncbi:WSSV349 [White spot syndrome virus]|uniref:WSSV349 n=1 Tax=White spot syndrome virus TaxID=342409 RepID=A0A2I6SC44_9VIRU|nr:WSSV349 [White spot syndrome virus]